SLMKAREGVRIHLVTSRRWSARCIRFSPTLYSTKRARLARRPNSGGRYYRGAKKATKKKGARAVSQTPRRQPGGRGRRARREVHRNDHGSISDSRSLVRRHHHRRHHRWRVGQTTRPGAADRRVPKRNEFISERDEGRDSGRDRESYWRGRDAARRTDRNAREGRPDRAPT